MSWIWPAGGGASGGGGARPVSTLQPLNYAANIVAAYALNEPAAACNVDRSGQGRDFVTAGQLASEMCNVMDLVPGKGAIMPALVNSIYSTQPQDCAQFGAYWQLQGELSLTFRYWSCPVLGLAQFFSPVYCNATPTATSSVAFQAAFDAVTMRFTYYAETLKVGQLFTSTLVPPANAWSFMSLRRRADGTVRLGIGTGPRQSQQTYQDSGALLLPNSTVAGPTWFARFGWNRDAAPVQPGGGPMADVIVWNRFLTDAELEPQYGAAMASLT